MLRFRVEAWSADVVEKRSLVPRRDDPSKKYQRKSQVTEWRSAGFVFGNTWSDFDTAKREVWELIKRQWAHIGVRLNTSIKIWDEDYRLLWEHQEVFNRKQRGL